MDKQKDHNDTTSQQPTKRKISFTRWVIRIATYILVTLFAFFTILYFLFDYAVKVTIQERFNLNSRGNYELNIEELTTNFFNQSIEISNLSITPIGNMGDSLYRIKNNEKAIGFNLKHGLLKVKSIKHFLLKDTLTLATFHFTSPHLTVWNYTPKKLKKDPRLQIQELLKQYTAELMVDNFVIDHASLDYHSTTQNGHFTHHIPDCSIYLKEVLINDQVDEVNLLFTPIYDIKINNYEYTEGIHFLKVGNLHAIGGNHRITISDLLYEKENKKIIELPLTTIIEPRIGLYIYKNKILLDSLLFQNPQITLTNISHQSSTSQSLKNNLVKLIESFTTDIKSRHIAIENADLELDRVAINGENSQIFNIINLTLNIDGTDISKETILDKSKVMFSDDILVSFDEFRFTDTKNNSSISLGKFSGKINDDTNILSDINIIVPKKANLAIKSVKIEQMDWRKLWDKQELDLHTFHINYPALILTTDKTKRPEKNSPNHLSDILFKNLAYKVDINYLSIKHGKYKQNFHGSSSGIKSQQASEINVEFRDIHFNKKITIDQPIKKALHEIKKLSFENYQLTPVNGDYKLYAKKINIKPRKQELLITGIRLDVKEQIDIEISSFKLLGLNWEEYLNTHKLEITKAMIQEPEIIADIKPKSKKTDRTHHNLKEVIPQVLSGFGSSISIDSLILENGFVQIQSGTNERVTQEADSLNLLIMGFLVDSSQESHDRFLFSDDLSFSFKNYHMASDTSSFELNAKIINVPSTDSLIVIKDISLKNKKSDSITIPQVTIKDIHWNEFWNNDTLVIKTVAIESPKIHLVSTKAKIQTNKNQTLNKIKTIFPHGLIKELKLTNGYLNFIQDTIGIHSIRKIDLNIEKFIFDSTFLEEQLPIKNLSFDLRDYSFENQKKTTQVHTDFLSGNTREGNLSIDNLHFKTKKLDIFAPKIQVIGFQTNKFYKEKNVFFEKLELIDSEITYMENSSFGPSVDNKDTLGLLDHLFTKINGIEGNKLEVVNTSVSVISPNSYHKVNHLNAELDDISITTTNRNDKNRILYSKQVQIRFDNYNYVNERKLKHIRFDSFEASSIDSLLEIKGFVYSPTLGEEEFLNNLRHRKTFFSMNSENISSTSFNFYELYNTQKLIARKLTIESPNLMIAENLKKERKEGKVPLMPNDIFRDLPFYMNIEQLEVHKANIIYNERAKKGRGTGRIYFTDTDALIENITNDTSLMSVTTPAIIRAHSQFMNQGSLSLIMTIPLLTENFYCEYQGTLGAMDAEIINEMIIPNANLGLKKGEVRRISFNAEIQDGLANGEMLAKYRSFKLQVYSKNQKRKTILGTFISNLLITKNNKKKKGKIYYQSTPIDSFVKILWGGIRSGLKDTLLPGFVLNKV